MGSHVTDERVGIEFMNSLRQTPPDFLFAAFMLERNPKAIDAQDNGMWTTAMHAAKLGKLSVLKWLHHRSSDMQKSDKHGHSPLHVAVGNKKFDCVQFLVNVCKVDINCKNTYGCTPGHWAAQNGDEPMLRWLASKNADLRAVTIGMWRPVDYAKRVPFGGRLNGKYKRHNKCITYLSEECKDHPGGGKFLVPATKQEIAKTKEQELRRRASVYKIDQKRNFQKSRKYQKPLFDDKPGNNNDEDLESLPPSALRRGPDWSGKYSLPSSNQG
jgi:hypothetical protein